MGRGGRVPTGHPDRVAHAHDPGPPARRGDGARLGHGRRGRAGRRANRQAPGSPGGGHQFLSDAKLEVAKRLGADVTINHTARDVARDVRSLTGVGADVVVDSVGERTWEASLRALRPMGTAGDLRCHDRTPGHPGHPEAVLVPVESAGLHHGQPPRIPGDRRARRARLAPTAGRFQQAAGGRRAAFERMACRHTRPASS